MAKKQRGCTFHQIFSFSNDGSQQFSVCLAHMAAVLGQNSIFCRTIADVILVVQKPTFDKGPDSNCVEAEHYFHLNMLFNQNPFTLLQYVFVMNTKSAAFGTKTTTAFCCKGKSRKPEIL